jgi:hypothetical protein
MSETIDMDKLMKEGKPFTITLATDATGALFEFVLDTDTYDGVAGFFEDKMLWISGMRLTTGAACIAEVRLDEILAYVDLVAGAGVDLSGILHESVTPIGYNKSSIKDVYGVPYLAARNKFSIQQTTTAPPAFSAVELWGVYTERTA